MEVMLRHIPNDYKIKKNFLSNHASEIELLVLGNSHFYRSVNPEYLTLKSFNASYVSQSLDIDAAIFKKYLDSLTHLKYLVINVSHASLYYLMQESPENWRLKNYNIYSDLHLSNTLAQHSELFSMKLNINLKRLLGYYILHRNEITTNPNGWGPFGKLHDPKGVIETGKIALKRHNTTDYRFFNTVTNRVNEIVDLAQQKKIQVIFITTPFSNLYRNGVYKDQKLKMDKFLEELISKNSNCQYFDFSNDSEITEEDFFDGDHLNVNGAQKFSIQLDSLIMNIENNHLKQ